MVKTWVIFLILIFSAFPALSLTSNETALSVQDEVVIRDMPLRKKIGQLFMIGFQGKSISDGLETTIRKISPGGLVVFGRNLSSPRQVSDLLIHAQHISLETSQVPLLIATDQEGGDVVRIKTTMPLPSALAIGKTNRSDVALEAGFATGRLLKTLGFNMNLAPVLDVADLNQEMFIGTRSYGNKPELVAEIGTSFAIGLSRAGVLPTGKHFPGHAGVKEDSHLEHVSRTLTLSQLRSTDLVPFVMLQNRLPNKWAAMLAHISYPYIDNSGVPATFSKKIVNGLLRTDLGFNGIVLTDEISMAGAGEHVRSLNSIGERAVRAIEAGADMIVVSWNKALQESLINIVESAVSNGRLSQERIAASLRKIFRAKKAFAATALSKPSDDELKQVFMSRSFLRVGDAVAAARFDQKLTDEEESLKSFSSGKPILVFSANDNFSRSFTKHLPSRSVHIFKLDVNHPYIVEKILSKNPAAVGVFYVSGYQAAKIAAQIGPETAKKILIVTVETAGVLKNASTFRYVTEIYYRHPSLGQLVAKRYFSND